MTIKAAIYARASTECPASIEDQVESLKTVASGHGWTIARIFTDRPMPMKRGREQRAAEMAMLAAIRAGGVDKVLLFSIDRIGKSIVDLVAFLETCRLGGVELYIHDQQFDTATNNGLDANLCPILTLLVRLKYSLSEPIAEVQSAAGHLNSITSRSAIGGGRIAAQAVGFPDRLDR